MLTDTKVFGLSGRGDSIKQQQQRYVGMFGKRGEAIIVSQKAVTATVVFTSLYKSFLCQETVNILVNQVIERHLLCFSKSKYNFKQEISSCLPSDTSK